jgi:hypothetical protein
MTRTARLAALLLLLVAIASGCRVHTTVTVDVAEDGSGTVEVAVGLDAAALAEVPDADGDGRPGPADVAALVRTEDLEDAGWAVSAPETDGGGGDAAGTTWLRVSRPFGTPEEAGRILAELTGPSGPLRDLRVTRSHSFGRTEYAFSGTADLSGGLEAFGDEGLAAALEGEPLGEDAAAIEQRTGQPLADTFTVEITSRLAGEATTWRPRLGDAPLAMAAESTRYDVPVLVLVAVAVAAALALVVVLATRAVRSRRS